MSAKKPPKQSPAKAAGLTFPLEESERVRLAKGWADTLSGWADKIEHNLPLDHDADRAVAAAALRAYARILASTKATRKRGRPEKFDAAEAALRRASGETIAELAEDLDVSDEAVQDRTAPLMQEARAITALVGTLRKSPSKKSTKKTR